jgi:hypothetical protein
MENPMKLTDIQLILLSRASQRDDRALELPPHLKGGSAQKVIARLLAEKLVEEIRSRDELPAWRKDEQRGPRTLRITKDGLSAIGAEEEQARGKQSDGGKAKGHQKAKPAKRARTKSVDLRTRNKTDGVSKRDRVLAQLKTARGATIAAIGAATGWQPHSVRGFLAGVVRKKLGLNLVSEASEEGRVYRIVGA